MIDKKTNCRMIWSGQKGIEKEYPADRAFPDPRIKTLPFYCVLPVCEVGCGSGRIAGFFKNRYTGIDINRAAIERAKELYPQHTFNHIQYDDPFPQAVTYLFHTVLLHVPDEYLVSMITRCNRKTIVVAESMDRKFRDDTYTFHRNPEEYEAIFGEAGYQLAYYRRFIMESSPGFWDLQIYSAKVDINKMYGQDYYDKRALRTGLREDQEAALKYALEDGIPELVVSVGCGGGELEQALEQAGVKRCVGIDPGSGLYKGREKLQEMFSWKQHKELLERADTLIFCESVEHVPFRVTQEVCQNFKGKLIITNLKDYHPIRPNGIDHITFIDDFFFEQIAEYGKVLHQKKSHFVAIMGKGRD